MQIVSLELLLSASCLFSHDVRYLQYWAAIVITQLLVYRFHFLLVASSFSCYLTLSRLVYADYSKGKVCLISRGVGQLLIFLSWATES